MLIDGDLHTGMSIGKSMSSPVVSGHIVCSVPFSSHRGRTPTGVPAAPDMPLPPTRLPTLRPPETSPSRAETTRQRASRRTVNKNKVAS